MSDKLKSTFSISDPAMANAAKRRLERLQEQQRIVDENRRIANRDAIGWVTLGRRLDAPSAVIVKRLAERFHVDTILLVNILCAGKFLRLDAETGLYRRAHEAREIQGPIIRKTWRAP